MSKKSPYILGRQWVWDYFNNKPVLKSEMTKEMLDKSEKARLGEITKFDNLIKNISEPITVDVEFEIIEDKHKELTNGK